VSEEVLGELACSILDGAKSLFLSTTEPSEKVCISAMSTLKKAKICKRSQMNMPNIYESDENESDAASIVSYSSSQLNGISGGNLLSK
jgi:hypothetical protein